MRAGVLYPRVSSSSPTKLSGRGNMARTKQSARRSAPNDDDEDNNGTQTTDVDYGTGKVEERPSYVLRWQIWHKKNKVWSPFDPDKIPAAPAKEYPDSFFIVNIRYKEASAEPELVISNWSERLLNFMRAVVGNDFFSAAPEYPVASLFLDMKTLRNKFTRAGELVTGPGYIGIEDKVKEVEKLGFTDAIKPATSWMMCKTYLTGLLEHLTPFMEYMNEQFAPVEEKLARLKEFGQMEFELLPYHFEPGHKLVVFDCPRGRPSAFKLTSRAIESDWRGRRMKLRGVAYKFDGDAFVQKGIETEIDEFKGTRPAQELEAIHLTAGIEEGLTKRGRLYASLSGVFHKDYNGKRVMLDPKAYANREGYDRDPDAVIKPLADDLLYLLPPDIEGFNLANKVCPECQRRGSYCPANQCKTWQLFDITKIKDVVFDENAWEHLVLDADTKLLVESLVRVTTNTNTTNEIITDVISGKGGGLISVLHGPPGTGKTLTAESIAEHLRRPMYMMGFAELSTTADKLENNLRKILKLATAWDAVLLIDEADVFLEQRSLHELERNALVSVALRLLEYHRGVLFLTTNRIKTFDEAFLSRFSIAIKYNELDHAGRLAVWKKFFELAGCRVGSSEDEGFTDVGTARVSSEDLEELAEKPFNGRTIKNLVRTAQALALSHGQPLSADHVKTVVRVQEKFLREFATVNH